MRYLRFRYRRTRFTSWRSGTRRLVETGSPLQKSNKALISGHERTRLRTFLWISRRHPFNETGMKLGLD